MKPIVEVRNISKRYNLIYQKPRALLREELEKAVKKPLEWIRRVVSPAADSFSKRREEFWALKKINFSVKQSETIGIIGPNGAGKSTLLKILAGVIRPTTGKVVLRGSVGSLLEIGAGFHPELTGRENIFLAGAVFGMNRSHVKERFAEIVAFSGVEKFLDVPVKFYSSGMHIRLAFSIAVQLEPDILLIDEVLAVGDAQFREKSLSKIEEIVRGQNRTILLVSHNIETIQRLCSRVFLLKNGRLTKGETTDVIATYLPSMFAKKKERNKKPQFQLRNTLIFSRKRLSYFSEDELIDIAERLYSPLPLAPIPNWSVGKIKWESQSLRYPLRLIWEELERRSQNEDTAVTVGWYNGIHLMLYPKSELSYCIFIEGCYEPNELYFLARILKEGMVFIDAGANIGIYSLFAASMVGKRGKVLAIEPSRREFKRLKKQVEKNACSNVRTVRFALSSKHSQKGELSIATVGAEGHNTLGKFAYKETRLLRKEKVDLETLDHLVGKESLKKIDIIKMDIEGAEMAALSGSKKTISKYKPLILLEISDKALSGQGYSSKDIWQFFEERDYILYRFNKKTGFPVRSRQRKYVRSENMIAVARNSDWETFVTSINK